MSTEVKKGFKVAPNPSCSKCSKTVYPMEQISADGAIYHKGCFKCQECKKALSLGAYSAVAGQIYCKPHFTQIFKSRGNYDTAFGVESHKAKWTPKEEPKPEPRKSRYADVDTSSAASGADASSERSSRHHRSSSEDQLAEDEPKEEQRSRRADDEEEEEERQPRRQQEDEEEEEAPRRRNYDDDE